MLQARLRTNSEQAAARLEGFLGRHIERIRSIGYELALLPELDEASFRRISSGYQHRYPGQPGRGTGRGAGAGRAGGSYNFV